MMQKPIYSVTVPCEPDSLVVLETLCETFLSTGPGEADEGALALRLAVAEGCRNALVQQPGDGLLRLASLSFFRHRGSRSVDAVSVEIRDPGQGLAIDGNKPPYPNHMACRDFVVTGGLGFEVVARVESPWIASLRIREVSHSGNDRRQDLLSELGRRGYGLLMLCRSWGGVQYRHSVDSGTTVHLSEPRVPPASA